MKTQIEIELNIAPDELAQELWKMDSLDQATFLCEMARIFRFNKSAFYSQMQEVSDELNNASDSYGKVSIIRLVETLLEYVKGGAE